IQIDPEKVNVAGIAAGWYDRYLVSYARAVRAYGRPVILSFGHEMNGWWYSWGHRHTSPADFVAAWQHIVTVFRDLRTDNVTWLWTVNIINKSRGIADPAPWWPGSSYVTWIGIDGYYHRRSWTFASLFGPTIKAVHMLTRHPVPILIAETGAAPSAGQPRSSTCSTASEPTGARLRVVRRESVAAAWQGRCRHVQARGAGASRRPDRYRDGSPIAGATWPVVNPATSSPALTGTGTVFPAWASGHAQAGSYAHDGL